MTHWPRALLGFRLISIVYEENGSLVCSEGVMALFRRATAGSNGHRDGWMVGGVCGGWMDGTLS